MTGCPDREMAIQALVDGELDSLASAALEAHLRDCAACAAALERLMAVRALLAGAAPRHAAPTVLRARIENMIAADAPGQGPARPANSASRASAWFGGGAIGAIAASLALLFAVPQLTTTALQDQLIDSHVRSLQAQHLVDVATSDRHVVKPWFSGRIDFTPPVVELAAQGFPLVGGRLDYLEGRPVAALVYRRGLHSINLFIRPEEGVVPVASLTTQRGGYSLARWRSHGFELWAVSDTEPGGLGEFREAFERAAWASTNAATRE